MIRDAIVMRSQHIEVMERCLDEGDELTLARAISIGQAIEASRESIRVIKVDDEDAKVHTIRAKPKKLHKTMTTSQYTSQRNATPQTQRIASGSQNSAQAPLTNPADMCGNCGYDATHTRCPARNGRCSYCNNIGHFKAVCRIRQRGQEVNRGRFNVTSQQANVVEADNSDSELVMIVCIRSTPSMT
jgi:predicted Zn-ribbon and HTH transcriptional regulator